MSKEEFVKTLSEQGYHVSNENGVVVVTVPLDAFDAMVKEMPKLVEKYDYRESFGVRVKQ